MDWEDTLRITLQHNVSKDDIEKLKFAFRNGDYRGNYRYNLAEDFCDRLDYMLEEEDFHDNVIDVDEDYCDLFDPDDTVRFMQPILTDFAKAMQNETFTCNITSSGSYSSAEIKADYDGKTLTYHYFIGNACYDLLVCDKCNYEGYIKELNEDAIHTCPECGNKIKQKYKNKTIKIEIK